MEDGCYEDSYLMTTSRRSITMNTAHIQSYFFTIFIILYGKLSLCCYRVYKSTNLYQLKDFHENWYKQSAAESSPLS
jgi:hypothetical protein